MADINYFIKLIFNPQDGFENLMSGVSFNTLCYKCLFFIMLTHLHASGMSSFLGVTGAQVEELWTLDSSLFEAIK